MEARPRHSGEDAGNFPDFRDLPAMVASQQLAQLGQLLGRSGNVHIGPNLEGSQQSDEVSQQIAPTLSLQNTMSQQNSGLSSNC